MTSVRTPRGSRAPSSPGLHAGSRHRSPPADQPDPHDAHDSTPQVGVSAGSTPAAGGSPDSGVTSEPGPVNAADRLAYSVEEAARLTGLSRDLLYDEMRRGNLSYTKVGRRRLITRQHLQQFLGIAS